MEEPNASRANDVRDGRYIAALAVIAFAGAVASDTTANAQMRSVRDTATAYGARLNARGEPANLNPHRINNRVNSRLETRLSLRVERYRPSSVADPVAAFTARPTDNARVGTATTLSPLSSSAISSASQAYLGSPVQTSSGQNDGGIQPR